MNGFEDFWTRYPRKVGKLAAWREWRRINPSPDVQAQIAIALEWQCPLWDDPQFVPHPRTWLHQGRWMDEPVRHADDRGHVPPCETQQACIARVIADGRRERMKAV